MSQRPLNGFKYVQTNVGDTLQRIAARELGDASRWPDIALINGLSYPYFTNDPNATTAAIKLYGATILVPAVRPAVPTGVNPNDALGTDLRLSNQGFLSDDGAGDLAVVSGPDNYAQAMRNVIVTDRGELLWHQKYGTLLSKIIGTLNGQAAALLAAGYVRAALSADPRTLSVQSVQATVVTDSISITAKAVTVNGTVPVQANT